MASQAALVGTVKMSVQVGVFIALVSSECRLHIYSLKGIFLKYKKTHFSFLFKYSSTNPIYDSELTPQGLSHMILKSTNLIKY